MSSRIRLASNTYQEFLGDLKLAETLFGHYFNCLDKLSSDPYYILAQELQEGVPVTVHGCSAVLQQELDPVAGLLLFSEAVFVAANVRVAERGQGHALDGKSGIWYAMFGFVVTRPGPPLPRERYEALAELRHWLASRHLYDFNTFLPETTTKLEAVFYE